MLKTIVCGALLSLSFSAFSNVTTRQIKTPRGLNIEVSVHSSSDLKKPTIIVAPGQSCNSKGPLFETLGVKGAEENYTVVRFEWAYCLVDPTKPIPSDDLNAEVEDFMTAMNFAKTLDSVDADKLIIAGKSLGSVVAYSVFQATPSAKGLILMTPLFSYIDENNTTMQTGDEYYPGLKKDMRPVFLTMGDADNACILNILFDFLKDSKGNILVNVAGGDHGFRVKNADQSVDNVKTQNNIESVIKAVINWATLKI